MGDERWRVISRLYDEAAALAPVDRAPFLRKACGGDDALRAEIESLLLDDSRVNELLEPKGSSRALIGQRIGGYEIRSLLGVGGTGEVYRARDSKRDRDVAIKVLPVGFAMDGERLARFQREARLLASLNHPHIGGIHGFEDASGVPALVLELVEGDTLAERLQKGPMPVPRALARDSYRPACQPRGPRATVRMSAEGTRPAGPLSPVRSRAPSRCRQEWVANAAGQLRFTLGGAWDTPKYQFGLGHPDARDPFEREKTFGFRCARYTSPIPNALLGPVAFVDRDRRHDKPVDDEAYKVLLSLHAYDKTELKSTVHSVEDASTYWRVEHVSFDAAYGNQRDRVIAHLYLPRNSTPPYQVVAFMGGSGIFNQPKNNEDRDVPYNSDSSSAPGAH